MGRGYMERDRILIDAIKLLSGVTVPIYLPTEDLQEPIFSPSVCIQYNIFLPWVVLNILIKWVTEKYFSGLPADSSLCKSKEACG